MPPVSPQKAEALVFDNQPANRQQVRTALLDWGFNAVSCSANAVDFVRSLRRPNWSLIVADAFCEGCEMLDVVRRIRTGDVGPNPFVFVVLTSWRADTQSLRDAINSGADDVVLRPFPQGLFLDRISRLMTRERRFVASADYLGPDRRRDPTRDVSMPMFSAPNLEQVMVRASQIHVPSDSDAKDETHVLLLGEQVRWLAMRVAMFAHLGVRLGAMTSARCAELLDTAKRFRRRLKMCGAGPQALSHAAKVVKAASALKTQSGDEKRVLKIAAEHAAAAYADFAGDAKLTAALRQAEEIAERIVARTNDADAIDLSEPDGIDLDDHQSLNETLAAVRSASGTLGASPAMG